MSAFFDVIVKFSLIFSFVAGLLGVILFLIMIFSLDLLRDIGNFFNRAFSLKKIERRINEFRQIDNIFFKYSKLIGIFIVISGILVIYSMFKNVNIEELNDIFNIKDTNWPFIFAMFKTMWLFTIISLCAGVIFGFVLIFDKDVAKEWSSFINKWYDSDEIEERLDNTILKDTDTICFLHNKIVGVFGLTASVFLLVLSSIRIYKMFF